MIMDINSVQPSVSSFVPSKSPYNDKLPTNIKEALRSFDINASIKTPEAFNKAVEAATEIKEWVVDPSNASKLAGLDDKTQSNLYYITGTKYDKDGNFDRAILFFKKSIDKDPNNDKSKDKYFDSASRNFIPTRFSDTKSLIDAFNDVTRSYQLLKETNLVNAGFLDWRYGTMQETFIERYRSLTGE